MMALDLLGGLDPSTLKHFRPTLNELITYSHRPSAVLVICSAKYPDYENQRVLFQSGFFRMKNLQIQ